MALIDIISRGGRPANDRSLGDIATDKQQMDLKQQEIDISKESLGLKRDKLLNDINQYNDKKAVSRARQDIFKSANEQNPDDKVAAANSAQEMASAMGDFEFSKDMEEYGDDVANPLSTEEMKIMTKDSIAKYRTSSNRNKDLLIVRPEILNPKTNSDMISSDKILAGWLQKFVADPSTLNAAQIDAVQSKYFKSGEEMRLITQLAGTNIDFMKMVMRAQTPEDWAALTKKATGILKTFTDATDAVTTKTDKKTAFLYERLAATEVGRTAPLTDDYIKSKGIDPEKYRQWKLTK